MYKRRKKTAASRKPGASKAPARRKRRRIAGTPAESPATIMISGIGRYKKNTCHKNKSEATKSAESRRAKGMKARVLKSGTGYCVYTRGRASKG